MMTAIRPGALVALLAVAACGSPKPASDTAAVPGVDTVKPAGADSMPADSTSATGATGTTGAPTAKASSTQTGTKARADTTKILGRDSVIMPKGKGGLPPVKRDTNSY